jgi:hypothetical protein
MLSLSGSSGNIALPGWESDRETRKGKEDTITVLMYDFKTKSGAVKGDVLHTL